MHGVKIVFPMAAVVMLLGGRRLSMWRRWLLMDRDRRRSVMIRGMWLLKRGHWLLSDRRRFRGRGIDARASEDIKDETFEAEAGVRLH